MSIENGRGIFDFDKRLVFETDTTPADPPAEEKAEEKKTYDLSARSGMERRL